MKYTKAERHGIYKKALKLLLSPSRSIMNMYLCWVIETASKQECFEGYVELLKEFPEVLTQKPKEMFTRLVWFDPNDRKSRIAVLKKAIKLTAPKPKSRTKIKTKTKKITKS